MLVVLSFRSIDFRRDFRGAAVVGASTVISESSLVAPPDAVRDTNEPTCCLRPWANSLLTKGGGLDDDDCI